MYWLLRAGEGGNEEAIETIIGLAEKGRGVTDHNYVDVVNIASVSRDVTTANTISKKMFRNLSRGNSFLTSVQLSRLVNESTRVPMTPIKNSKCTEEELVENVCEYMDGKLPTLDQSLLKVLPEKSLGVRDLATSNVFIMSCTLSVFFHQFITSQLSIASSSLLPMMLLAATLATRKIQLLEFRFKVWSSIFSLFTSRLDTRGHEETFSSRQSVFPFLIFHSILAIHVHLCEQLTPNPFMYFVLVLGSATSIYVLLLPRSVFLIFLSLNALCCWQEDVVVSSLSNAISIPVLSNTSLVFYMHVSYLLPICLTCNQKQVQTELQALAWEALCLQMIMGKQYYQVLLLISGLGMVLTLWASFKYRIARTWFLACILILATVSYSQIPKVDRVSNLSWSDYQSACLPEDLNLAGQVACLGLDGHIVEWSGQVDSVKISHRSNMVEWIVARIPHRSEFSCILGRLSKIRQYSGNTSSISSNYIWGDVK